MQGLPTKHDSHNINITATLTENNDKLVGEHGKLLLHGQVNQPPSKDTSKWWECGGHVRGKKQSRESDAAGERGASGQPVTEERRASSFVPSGHRPGLMSDLGGVAGWLSKPRQGAPVRTKEAARVAHAEAPPVQAKL